MDVNFVVFQALSVFFIAAQIKIKVDQACIKYRQGSGLTKHTTD